MVIRVGKWASVMEVIETHPRRLYRKHIRDNHIRNGFEIRGMDEITHRMDEITHRMDEMNLFLKSRCNGIGCDAVSMGKMGSRKYLGISHTISYL